MFSRVAGSLFGLALLGACEPQEPDFQKVKDIYNLRCFGRTCHVGADPAGEGLLLGSDFAYQATVGAPARQKPGLRLVEPGNADASYLYCKIRPGCGPIFGERMPLDLNLSAADIETIRVWIDAGAPDENGVLPPALTNPE
jgi:hypothetical protein